MSKASPGDLTPAHAIVPQVQFSGPPREGVTAAEASAATSSTRVPDIPSATQLSIDDSRSRLAVGEDRQIKDVRARLDGYREDPKLAPFKMSRKVSEAIVGEFQKRGTLLHDRTRCYAFLKGGRVLLPIESQHEGLELALFEYGLLPKDRLTADVIDTLRLTARSAGQETEVHAFSYFDRKTSSTYIYDFRGGVFVASPLGIKHCDNGVDGHLFVQNLKWKPFELARYAHPRLDWRDWLIRGVAFSDGNLTAHDSQLLIGLWVLALYFPQLFPTRPILALIGEKGSGKSSLLRRIGRLLFGPKFDVTTLTSKSDDFDAAITTDPLVVADNADDAPSWFADKLAVVATGGELKRRDLYTTNKLVDFPIRAYVGVTSRTPDFLREDVAERLLPIRVSRLPQFSAENDLLDALDEHREQLLAGLVADVQRATVELAKRRQDRIPTMTRLADFASFAIKVAPVIGSTEDEIRQLLERLDGQQVNLAAQDDALMTLIDQWLADDSEHVNIGRDLSTSDLMRELEAHATSDSVPWERGNTRSFGQYFRTRSGTLKTLFGMVQRSCRAGATCVSFHHRQGELGDSGVKTSSGMTLVESSELE